jgi:hypothetical protein
MMTELREGRQDTRERLHYRRRRDDCNCSVQTTAQQIFNANAGLRMFSAAPVLQSVVLDTNNDLSPLKSNLPTLGNFGFLFLILKVFGSNKQQ